MERDGFWHETTWETLGKILVCDRLDTKALKDVGRKFDQKIIYLMQKYLTLWIASLEYVLSYEVSKELLYVKWFGNESPAMFYILRSGWVRGLYI